MTTKKNNRTLIIIISVLVLAGIGIFLREKFKEELPMVTFGKVEKSSITEIVSASGKIHPETEVKISSDVSGEIVELLVAEGDSVITGMMLAKIKPDNYVSAVERAESALNSIKAQLAQAKARKAQNEANFIKTELSHKRNVTLYEQKVISESDMEASKAAFDISKHELNASKEAVVAAEYEVSSATATVKETKENLSKTTILSPAIGIISKLNVEKGERVVGTLQMSGTELMRIANLNTMEVRVNVNENDIIRVSPGDTAIIEVDSYTHQKEKFKGIVTQISSTANETMNLDQVTDFEVKIRILRDSYTHLLREETIYPSPFRPGMTASVEIITDRKNNVLSVPVSSVTTRSKEDLMDEESDENKRRDKKETVKSKTSNDKKTKEEIIEVVFIYENGKSRVREVKTGISDDKNIEILSGLNEGQTLIEGPYNVIAKILKEGTEVKEKEKKKK